MTDQTISVPADLLKELKTRYPASIVLGDNPIAALAALAPADPLKVGDVIDTTEKADGLEAGTVLRDNVGDLWVVSGNGSLFYTKPSRSYLDMSALFRPDFAAYRPTIIALPED